MSVSYLGVANHRRQNLRFGIRQADRLAHVYVIGQTGVGKSTLLGQLAEQDGGARRGFALIDPHGDLADALATRLRQRGIDFTYLDAANQRQPYGYNPLRKVRADKVPLAASGLLETFKKLWPDAWGVRMEHILRNSLFTLLEWPDATLPDILRLYTDKVFRQKAASSVSNPVVRAFWKSEFAHYQPRFAAEALAPIQNKLGALLSDPMLYRVLVEPEIDLRFRSIMDRGQILLVNLAKGRIGSDSADTLGSLLVSTLGLAAMSRADLPAELRQPYFMYVDEFQNFTTLAFASMMAEMRKFGFGLVLAHQHLHQLEPDIRHAVLGNAGSLICFRTGVEDAALFAKELAPAFDTLDLINLPNRRFYARLMIDGAPSVPFSAQLTEIAHPAAVVRVASPSATSRP
jgi:type IV secretory pathway TraG/TraD family ATPase VirD4